MKVIIVGAGNVGLAAAKAALRGNDVHIIEKDMTTASTARSVINASIIKGDASNPNMLRSAIDRVHPDVILSTVNDDGINIFICMNAKRINAKIRTIACIRDPAFLTSNGYEGVDVLISPDTLSVEKMNNVAMLENATNYEALNVDGYSLTTFKVETGHDVVGRTIMNLKLPKDCTIAAVYREGLTLTDIQTTEIHVDDRIVLLGTAESTAEFNKFIGIKKESKEFVILGAGRQGLSIAKSISDTRGNRFVKILDEDLERCREATRFLRNSIVVNGNIVDPQFLHSENIERADTVISVTDVDEKNLLACMTSLRFGIKKIISKYSIEEYEDVFKYAGIESVVGYHKIITNEVIKNLMTTENYSVHVMEQAGDYFISSKLDRNSPLSGRYYGDLVIPTGMNICAVKRNGNIFFPDILTLFTVDDEVFVYCHLPDSIELSKLLGKNMPEL